MRSIELSISKRCCGVVLLVVVGSGIVRAQADDYQRVLLPLLQQHCVDCHGNDEANAELNFDELSAVEDFLDRPALIEKVLEAIDSAAMPPDGELALEEATRINAANSLRSMLRKAVGRAPQSRFPVSRLNRFQYNNTVRDLFQLKRDVFALPEKLMTRHDNYLYRSTSLASDEQMPETVQVASHSLLPLPGFRAVESFPKDLRAEHGFDNQASQLTLSPLLLDAFLRLGVSIVESPDFNSQTVGIWNEFFAEPNPQGDRDHEIRVRLHKFLRVAFRSPVDDATIDRYTAYAKTKIDQSSSFPDGMKKVAAAALSSPLFLYRSPASEPAEQQFTLASRLSYFLWASCPDDELLQLADDGQLTDPKMLDETTTRMLADPKIERFLDSFPTQWMQLENVLAATPDPQINRYFALSPDQPASLQMVLEPLLLFDTVFVENRPIVELLAPAFTYQSEFLKTWYHSDLSPPPLDTQSITAENDHQDAQRRYLQNTIAGLQTELSQLVGPVRARILAERRNAGSARPTLDLKPYAVWDFENDLSDPIHGLDLSAQGEIQFRDGRVVLDNSYLQSQPLPIDLNAKSLEVWFQLQNLDQRGGGLMGIQGPGNLFDSIAIGERKIRHWISSSNGASRTEEFPESFEESVTDDLLHLVMVYQDDGTTTLYRNGQPYGQPYQKGMTTFARESSSVLFGLRHPPASGKRFLSVSIDHARLYDRALTPGEVEAAATDRSTLVSTAELIAEMTPEQQSQRERLIAVMKPLFNELDQVPANVNLRSVIKSNRQQYDNTILTMLRSREFHRVPLSDPRYGGIITNAAMLSMTSGPKRTHPVARGVWVIEVIFNDPPEPPPNDVPPLNEDAGDKDLTIREQFAAHRENPSCAGCHTKLDPLGFALENFDITGRWRDRYENGRTVDASGTLMRKHDFAEATSFKAAIVNDQPRFAKAFTKHLLRFALAQELSPADTIVVDDILTQAAEDNYCLKTLIREIIRSERFRSAESVSGVR